MKIGVSYISTDHYDRTNIMQWVWFFRPYKFINGFQVRIFGVHFNVRESNSTEKLIKIHRERQKPS